MNILEHILTHPDDLETYHETLPSGAVLRIWRNSKLVSGHGIHDSRTPVPTGGLTFEVTFPAPLYGPAKPYISRLRADHPWDSSDARLRYEHVLREAERLSCLNKRRDALYLRLVPFETVVPGGYEALISYAFDHHLTLDVEDMGERELTEWEQFFHIPIDKRIQ